MNIDRNLKTQRILDLTLEMLHLLTREEHTVVKISGGRGGDGSKYQVSRGSCKTQRASTDTSPLSVIHERHNEQKILELTHRILRLLTGEVPIRCEDVTVHLSMEEWEYVERHKELYKDVMMEDHQPVITAGKSVSGEFHNPLVTECGSRNLSENINNHGGTFPPEHRPGEDPISRIKEEEGNLSYTTDLYRPAGYVPAAEESLKGDINQSEISSAKSIIESREPNGSKCHEANHKANINVHPSASENGKVLHSDPKGLVICETNCKGGKSSDREEDFPQRSDLKHQHVHAGEQPVLATEGKERFTDNATLITQHKVQSGRRLFKCSQCGKYFTRHSSLKKHRLIHTGEKPFKCPECGKSFRGSSELASHIIIHTGDKPHKCSDCGKCFTRPAQLASHQRVHTGEKPFSCSECGKCFPVKAYLQRHMKIHAKNKTFECAECGKCFIYCSELAKHQRIHTGEKPFKCTECGKCFAHASDVAAHKRIHTGLKPFKCTECGKCFTAHVALVRHQRVHTGEKPIKCNECGECFSWHIQLTAHKWIHSSEKPFSCSECGKCFTLKPRLTRHIKTHTKNMRHIIPLSFS